MPPRYVTRADRTMPRRAGVWDRHQGTWYSAPGHSDAYYFSGVPMWTPEDAERKAAALNGKAVTV